MADAAAPGAVRDASLARPVRPRPGLAWLGLVPFFAFSILFLVLPISLLVIGSLQGDRSEFTLKNYAGLVDGSIGRAYMNSIEISAVTAILGGFLGFLLAAAVILGGLPRFLRTAVMTFSGVASNFAGIPLALAFIFTIGQIGMITVLLQNLFGWNLWTDGGFNLYTKVGLEIVYLYFQFPLMVLIIAPAIDGLKREWREASENLGASSTQYWRHVASPVLMPSLMGCMILLFGNAFGAQATAYQLTSGQIPIITLLIVIQMSGDVVYNPGLGYAMAVGMVLIMGVSIFIYSQLQRRSERWLRS